MLVTFLGLLRIVSLGDRKNQKGTTEFIHKSFRELIMSL